MDLLLLLFIMYVLSKIFGGFSREGDKGKKGQNWPLPGGPTEWEFPRPKGPWEEHQFPDEKPTLKRVEEKVQGVISDSSFKERMAAKEDAIPRTAAAPPFSTGRVALEKMLQPENLVSGIILAEILKPPVSRRGAR